MADEEWRELARRVYETGELALAKKLVRVLRRIQERDDPTLQFLSPGPPPGFPVGWWARVLNFARGRRYKPHPRIRDLARALKSRRRSWRHGFWRGKLRGQLLAIIRAAGLDAPDEHKKGLPRRRRVRSQALFIGSEPEVSYTHRPLRLHRRPPRP